MLPLFRTIIFPKLIRDFFLNKGKKNHPNLNLIPQLQRGLGCAGCARFMPGHLLQVMHPKPKKRTNGFAGA